MIKVLSDNLVGKKLASLEATLVQNFDPATSKLDVLSDDDLRT